MAPSEPGQRCSIRVQISKSAYLWRGVRGGIGRKVRLFPKATAGRAARADTSPQKEKEKEGI